MHILTILGGKIFTMYICLDGQKKAEYYLQFEMKLGAFDVAASI